MCIYLNHCAVHVKITQIVNQLYFNLKRHKKTKVSWGYFLVSNHSIIVLAINLRSQLSSSKNHMPET